MDIQSNLDNLIFANLLFVTIVCWASLVFPKFKFLSKLGFYGNCCASSCLFILLGSRWLISGYFPLSNLYESLMFLAWGITSLGVIIEDRSKVSIIGSISTPISLFVTGFASLSLPEAMQSPSSLVPALKSNWLMMHVTVMMLSYASLLIGSLLSIFFLVLVNNKKEKVSIQGSSYGSQSVSNSRFTENIAFYKTETTENYSNLLSEDNVTVSNIISPRLTLLESIDNLSYRTISFGFPLLTVGIIAGAVWANEAWGSYWSWDPKETWALITWLVFAIYLHSRLLKGWQGKKAAALGSAGFFVIWICYLGVNFLGKGLHSYGWVI